MCVFLRALILFAMIGQPVPSDERLELRMGKELFDRNWVEAPSTTRASDGLGPLFNARACATCHPAGGAGEIREKDGVLFSTGLVARFSDEYGNGDPHYGDQLQTGSVSGIAPEGRAGFREGRPFVVLESGPLSSNTKIGLRRAPTLAGRGLIARVTEDAILQAADPFDADGDGISGRARMNKGRPGRFGWKAEHVTLEDQVAAAFSLDMGLSSARFPQHSGDCTPLQETCRAGFDGSDELGEGFELSQDVIDLVTAYVGSLGRERPGSAEALALFISTGCAACHSPEMPTEQESVAIYSDLLLHDMGDGLADESREPQAIGAEWRTAPLIGLVTSNSRLLHDGRAGTVEEAIEWHGGEAKTSKTLFKSLKERDRSLLLRFVEGL